LAVKVEEQQRDQADLAGHAIASATDGPVEDEPAADAVRGLTYKKSRAAARPQVPSASAANLASSSTNTRMQRRFWSVAGRLTPSEPDIVADAETVPVSASPMSMSSSVLA
jgi:hypothetical protein